MKLISVNVGLPQQVRWRGKTVTTAIFKSPVKGRVHLGRLNLDGDRQADLTVHGGADKAVYVYPAEHYEFWGRELPAHGLPDGSFGENFTTIGLTEDAVNIGDRLRVGSAEVVVTQPRLPCYKLGMKFGQPEMVKRFADSRRTGFYLAVEYEGEVSAGDAIEVLSRDENRVPVSTITQLYLGDAEDSDILERVIQLRELPLSWREHFLQRINRHENGK
jgi:MOSC domain-containing protein YiiM